jgi:SGF29 tudor-like domain
VVLGGAEKLGKGDIIFAVYPDTTAFYQATVVQAPRKSGGGSFVMVNFVDDGDEHGITHDKAVPIQHVMLPPYGATIQ